VANERVRSLASLHWPPSVSARQDLSGLGPVAMSDRKTRGLLVVAALAAFLVLSSFSNRLDDVSSLAEDAQYEAERAAGSAEELEGRLDDLESRTDELESSVSYRYGY
jgi:hypothetical protein